MVIPLKRKAIRIMGLFDVFMNEIIEMMYLTEEGFILSRENIEDALALLRKPLLKQDLKKSCTF
ncbi:MAG TPA: hypothetical protein VK111_14625 [Virgibacillus sp.]|nr:hypothetical protein [Virgibacillus sp.]